MSIHLILSMPNTYTDTIWNLQMASHFLLWHLLGNLKQNTKIDTMIFYDSAQWLTMIHTSIALWWKSLIKKDFLDQQQAQQKRIVSQSGVISMILKIITIFNNLRLMFCNTETGPIICTKNQLKSFFVVGISTLNLLILSYIF